MNRQAELKHEVGKALAAEHRRRFFYQLGSGLGSVALSWMLQQDRASGAEPPPASPLAPKPAHFRRKPRR